MTELIKVLILEDEADYAEIVARELARSGYEPDWVRVDTEADFRGRVDARLDVILADYYVPRFDALRAVRVLRERGLDVPLIIVSGAVGEQAAIEAMREGAADYLFKDNLARLGMAVARAIQARRGRDELRLRNAALTAAANAVAITGRDGAILWVNPAFTTMTGYAAAEAIGQTPRILKSGKHDEAFYDELWHTILEGRTWQARIVNRRKDGTELTVEQTITPVRDETGEITSFISIQQDVTGRLALEERYRQAQKMEAIGQLAGGVAHDFNNLLTVICGYAEVAVASIEDGDPLLQDIGEIQHAALRAGRLTRQLLAFSRKQIRQPAAINLNDSVATTIPMLRRLLREDVELGTNLESGLPDVLADAGQIEQVLVNLAVNARDAMPDGGRLTIETAFVELGDDYAAANPEATSGPSILLRVSDTGAGMSPTVLAHVFEPFFTTKGVGKGTGLGLATVYGIVSQSGGSIEVSSAEGVGSSFEIYLPVTRQMRPPPPAARAVATESGSPRGIETVLVVEDEEAVRRLATTCLRTREYSVLEATSGWEALDVCERHRGPIDLLLTDVVMPRMSGPQLVDRLGGRYPGMKVLFMSGHSEDKISHHGVLDPGVEFIGKPFSMEALVRRVREVLDS